jgi:hypothetical protein
VYSIDSTFPNCIDGRIKEDASETESGGWLLHAVVDGPLVEDLAELQRANRVEAVTRTGRAGGKKVFVSAWQTSYRAE